MCYYQLIINIFIIILLAMSVSNVPRVPNIFHVGIFY